MKLKDILNKEIEKRIIDIDDTSIWEDGILPVSPKEFFDKWLKSSLYPKQQKAVDNILVEKKGEEYLWSDKYNEAYLLWGEGSGKDFCCARIMTYALYWLLCLKNPQKYFNIKDKKSSIDLVNVSFDEDQAKDVYFKELKKALKSTVNPKTGKNFFEEISKKLKERNPEEQELKIKEYSKIQTIQFPKYITCYSLNSREYKAEGKSVIMAIFDEMGVFKTNKAEEMYKSLKGNMVSRFPKNHKFIAISYKRDDHDYMMVRWDETKNDKKVYRSGPFATWEVNLRVKKEDFNKAYERDPEDSERRYECKGSTSKEGYFKYKSKIKENINKNRISPIIEDIIPVRNILNVRYYDWFVGKNEDIEYVVHIDLAKGMEGGDCAGFVMGHKEPTEDEDKPKIIVDVMMQLKAEPGKEIQFGDIRKHIHYLISVRKFNIVKVTLDGYQSVDFCQILRNRRIESELLSVDKDTIAYDTMKGLIYQNRLDYYNYLVFIRECEELKLINRKVDHPDISRRRAMEEKDERGSKDTSDGVAGICKSLLMAKSKKPPTQWMDMGDEDSGVSADGNIVYNEEEDDWDE